MYRLITGSGIGGNDLIHSGYLNSFCLGLSYVAQ